MWGIWLGLVHMSGRRQALLVFAASFLVRCVYLITITQFTAPPPEYNEQVRMASYLLHGAGFVSPIGPERSDPSSWYPPGYIGLLTALFWLFGERTTASWVAARLLNIAAISAAVAIWTLLARYYLGRRVAAMAAVLLVLSPSITSKAHDIWDTFPACLGGALCLSMFTFYAPRRLSAAIGAGALCGTAALINPCFTLCYPVWVLWGLWAPNMRRGRIPFFQRGPFVLSVLCGFAVVVFPWTLRNRLTFGEWFYLRGNLPFELWSGNAPWSNGYGVSDYGRRLHHPAFDPAESERLVAIGEFAYFKQCGREVRQWLRDEPGAFVRRSINRMRWFWFGRYVHDRTWKQSVLKFAGYGVPGFLALVGTGHTLIYRRSAMVLVLTLMIFPIPYYICVTMARYRLPLEPLVLVMASAGALVLLKRFAQPRRNVAIVPDV